MFSRLFGSVLGVFLSWWGVGLLAALDSTLLFSLPFGIDIAVVLVSARHRDLFWLYAAIASAGSIVGAISTYWLGWLAGEKGLDRYVNTRWLDRVRRHIQRHGAIELAALDLVPPPFPFTLFAAAAGALKVSTRQFFITLAVCRLARFGLEAWLGSVYGTRIVHWLESSVVKDIGGGAIVLAVGLSVFSGIRLYLRSRTH